MTEHATFYGHQGEVVASRMVLMRLVTHDRRLCLLAAQSGWACPAYGAHLLAQRERLVCPNHLARGV
jgi:hypothetical protein